MPKLYLPQNWYAPAVPDEGRHMAPNRPFTSGMRFRASGDTSLEQRRDVSRRFIGRFPPRVVKKREKALDAVTGKVTTVVREVTVSAHILPSDIRLHPLNRHVFDEQGEPRPPEEWGEPPVSGHDPLARTPFAAARREDMRPMSATDASMLRVAAQTQEAQVVTETKPSQDETRPVSTETRDAAAEAEIEEALNQAAAEAAQKPVDYDPHDVSEEQPKKGSARDRLRRGK